MDEKRSQHELRRIIETAVAEVCGLPRPGVWFCVDQVQASGHPIASMTVWATLHFLLMLHLFVVVNLVVTWDCLEKNCKQLKSM